MCRIFAAIPPEAFASETRSIRLGKHATSIRLEAAFWVILEEIAASQQMTLPKFLTTLQDEVLEAGGQDHNFASLLRCTCLTYVTHLRGHGETGQSFCAMACCPIVAEAAALRSKSSHSSM